MRNGKDGTQAADPPERGPSSEDCDVAYIDTTGMTSNETHDELVIDGIGDGTFLGLDKVEPPAPPNRKQWVSFGIFVLMSIAMIATGLVVTVASEKKKSTLAAEQARLEESTKGRSLVLQTWIESHLLTSRRLTQSELVRLFVNDLALNPVRQPLPRSLLDQRPYFQTLMADFAKQNDLVRAAIIDEKGRLLLSSSGPPLDIEAILASVGEAPVGWKSIISAVRPIGHNDDRLVIDILAPLPKTQVMNETSGKSKAFVVQTLPINSLLNSLLTVSSQRDGTEKLHLAQERANTLELVELGVTQSGIIRPFQNERFLPGQIFSFGRWSIFDDQPHYSLGEPVPGVRWTIVHSVEAQAALAPVNHFIIVATAIALVIVLAFSFCLVALWWFRLSVHHHELISLYQSLAERLNKQRRFLVAVTNSITDWLVVSSKEDRCVYVNPAFTTALGLTDTEILGRKEQDVLPLKPFSSTGDALDNVIAGEQVNVLDIGDRSHFISTSSANFRDHDGQLIGTVTVMRDQSELVEQRQQRLRVLTETIGAFVHAIERRDPFLLGHTRRLRSYAIAVGRKLSLDNNDLAGLALAASLSQVGKTFVPNKILIKPKRHNQQETEIMRGHIDHTLSILGCIDFGFPVVKILSQMHERLDGSGYPKGLTDIDIDLPGRVLGVVDVFCARTAPRSYRDRLSAGNALYHLANNANRYDLQVIAALAEVVAKEDVLDPANDLDAGFLDAQTWKNLQNLQDPKLGAIA